MNGPPHTTETLRFGPFELDVRSRELRTGKTRVRLQDQPFEILRMMLERPGHVVTREELRSRLWPNGTFVDFEHSLNAAVKRLRAALGDEADNPRFVETLPRRGYRLIVKVSDTERPIDSLAVLPLINAGGSADTEYLSDGLTENLINNLSRLRDLKVMSRHSVLCYKGREVDAQTVGNTLHVRSVLMGQVMTRGDALSISVELVDARDKSHIWGEQYNRKAADLLAVQSEIAREITEKLRLRLTTGEQQQLARLETVNPQAYELMLKGRFYWNKGSTESRRRAIDYYQQAIVVDPAYALAYAELAKAYSAFGYRGIIDPAEAMPRAEAAALRALAIDERLAEAHAWLAYIKQCAWDAAGAEREFKRAQELNPNYAEAHGLYAVYLSQMQRHEQAVAEAKRAKELDPLSPSVNISYFLTLHSARRYNQAIDHLKQMLELDQNVPLAHVLFGHVYAANGQHQEAIAAYKKAMKLGIDNTSVRAYLGHAHARAGQRQHAQVILSQLQRTKEYVSPTDRAILHAGLGQKEQAFRWLETAYSARDLQLIYLGMNPHFDTLRSDPRFQHLMRSVGLPQ